MSRNVVYATDENYWMPLYVSLYSMLKNNKDKSFKIYIVCETKNKEFVSHLDYLTQTHDSYDIEFLEIDPSTFSQAPEPEWFSRGIYYRLLIGSILPIENKKILYIDCDTLVLGSIDEIFDQDISDSVAAAVPEFHNRSFWMGLPPDATQYNTGVMVINLEMWDEYDIQRKALEFIDDSDTLQFPLQEIMNILLHQNDNWATLDPKYNAMIGEWVGTYDSEKWEREFDPRIIHFCGRAKPWLYLHDPPYNGVWWDYLDSTPYRYHSPRADTFREIMLKRRQQVEYVVSSKIKSYPKFASILKATYKKFIR